MLTFCDRVNVFGERCRGVSYLYSLGCREEVFSVTELPALSLIGSAPHPTVSRLKNRTTNQKVAGSSPAERATESPANRGVLLLRFIRFPGPKRLLTAI